jgi:hypothetical protein
MVLVGELVVGDLEEVFPPELWGPYGPWSLIKRILDRAVARLIGLIKRF